MKELYKKKSQISCVNLMPAVGNFPHYLSLKIKKTILWRTLLFRRESFLYLSFLLVSTHFSENKKIICWMYHYLAFIAVKVQSDIPGKLLVKHTVFFPWIRELRSWFHINFLLVYAYYYASKLELSFLFNSLNYEQCS